MVKIYIFEITLHLFTEYLILGVSRSLRYDIARYHSTDISQNTVAKSGWMRIHGDVFRLPFSPDVLLIGVCNGIHLLFIISITICKWIGYEKKVPNFWIVTFIFSNCHIMCTVSTFWWLFNHLRYAHVCGYKLDFWIFFRTHLQHTSGKYRLGICPLLSGHLVASNNCLP